MATLTKVVLLLVWICLCFSTITALPWPFSWLVRWRPPLFELCPTKDLLQHECFKIVSSEYNCTTIVKNTCSNRERRGIRFSQTVSGPCNKRKKTVCKNYSCKRQCCNGWQRGIDGRCTLGESDPVIECHNGGTPSGNKCVCTRSFTGSRCETAICEPKCMNNGVCDFNKTLTRPVCVCNTNFTGESCEQVRCGDSCKNGGTCVGDNGSTKCLCVLGYNGQYCESLSIDKCPSLAKPTSQIRCNDTQQCNGEWEKCCIHSKLGHGVCMPLVESQTCTLDDTVFRVGENVTTGCEVCSCIQSSAKNGKIVCEDICSHKNHWTNLRNYQNCCNNKPANYIRPMFLNCPKKYEIVIIETWGNNSFGNLKRNYIKAEDWEGQRLNVRLSAHKFQACNSFKCLDHSVMAVTERDHYGLQSHCEFKLRVIDTMKPVFTSCPANIYGFNEKISWPRPHVYDNVGVASVYLEQPFRNGSKFEIGTTILTYRAQDFQGNVAKCFFIIRIYQTDIDEQSMPDELRSRAYVSPGIIVGGSVVGALAIALLVLAIILIKICRLKKQADHVIRRNRNEIPPSYDEANTTNDAIFKLNPPPYDIAAKDKLPEYTLKDDPPVYNDVIEERRDSIARPSSTGPVYVNTGVKTEKNEHGKFESTI